MRRVATIIALWTLAVLTVSVPVPAVAQTAQPQATGPELAVFTSYPSQVIGIEETPNISLKVRSANAAQVVHLEMGDLPEGWTATFRGGGTVIRAVYAEPGADASVTVRLEPPVDVSSGTYSFLVVARGENATAELPLELIIQDKLPPKLAFDIDLPTIKGSPTSTFRFSATLKNEGDEDLTVDLLAEAPTGFEVTFRLTGNEVTSLPLEANGSKTLSIEAKAFRDVPAEAYPITVYARGGAVQASLNLTAEVTGEPELSVTAPDGRLSGRAYAGDETPLKVLVQNTGSAPARAVELSATAPSGWSVEFSPERIDEVPAGQQVEATVNLRPADKALAGDYMVTVRARPQDGASESVDFRITVLTSTLWGIVGVALIAVAVGVVALAVLRFGRR